MADCAVTSNGQTSGQCKKEKGKNNPAILIGGKQNGYIHNRRRQQGSNLDCYSKKMHKGYNHDKANMALYRGFPSNG